MAHSSRGFALLLSVLVISMILSVALGITNIVIKENQLSALVRESEAAFHAADKGIDCALFYHISYDRTPLPNGTFTTIAYSPFPTSSIMQYPNMAASAGNEMSLVTCENNGVNTRLDSLWGVPTRTLTTGLTKFQLNFLDGSCVAVEVFNYKNALGEDASTITAEGYNTCNTASPIRTLRVIEVKTSI